MKKSQNNERRRFLTLATSALGAVGAAGIAVPFIKSWNPSIRAQVAGAPVEVDISKLERGAQLTVEWRGKPVWIVRRTEEMITLLEDERVSETLRDPHSQVEQQPTYAQNALRSRKPEYLVLIGKCTHLNCSPKYKPQPESLEQGWQGGFYCPCHGSKFDLSGRVYKDVPAPTNMMVPPYVYLSDTRVLIGVDNKPGEVAA